MQLVAMETGANTELDATKATKVTVNAEFASVSTDAMDAIYGHRLGTGCALI